MRRLSVFLALAILVVGVASLPGQLVSRDAMSPDFVHFESGQVHPLAMTPSGERLLAVNTPDNHLSVYDLTSGQPVRVAEVPVGMEPVSVAALDDSTAWVVNQLSDDVSIVNLNTLHVEASLRVGDEPADVVFAGTPVRGFVSVAEEDVVRVYDPATRALMATIPINGANPRALARNAAGTSVYTAVFFAGNRTSVLSEAEAFGNLPAPNPPMSGALPPAPNVALIIQEQAGVWRDESGQNWSAVAQYSMHEVDVAEIQTSSLTVVDEMGDLGTINFGLAVNPVSGAVAVTSTEARNLTRFEPNLRGHNVDTQVSLVPTAGPVVTSNLNPHVNYAVTPGPQAELDSALGIPTGVAFSGDGLRAYVTSLTSNRLGVLDAATGAVLARVPTVSGPTGVLVDDARGQAYVLGRFENRLQTLSLTDFSEVGNTAVGFDPTPDELINGRKFFYGGFTSGHGEHACATCHVFGDFDNISWDLGDPQGAMQPVDLTGQIDPTLDALVHPMKGPMATQTLRGLANTGDLHWRADRADLFAFNGAFVSLLGRGTMLPDSEMAAFTAFTMALTYPPNPYQHLDRTMPDAPPGQPSALRGQDFYFNQPVDGGLTCNICHVADNFGPGTNGQIVNNMALLESQDMKIPQLRNMYKKTGFTDQPGEVNKRGFGYVHSGEVDNLFNFLEFPGFNFPNDDAQRDVEAFLLAFDTGMAPSIGYRLTFELPGDVTASTTLDTLIGQGDAGNCAVIAKGRIGDQARGWMYLGGGMWRPDKSIEADLSTAALGAFAGLGGELTFMGVPVGNETRMGIDRDRDGFRDGDELDAGSDPGNPASTPNNVSVVRPDARTFVMLGARPNPFRGSTEIHFKLGARSVVDATVYDVMGREVRSLARGVSLQAGSHALRWDGRSSRGAVGPGVYFVRVKTDAVTWTRPIVRIR